ncbi:hypothetical protein D3C73_984540 [compost metagenome]
MYSAFGIDLVNDGLKRLQPDFFVVFADVPFAYCLQDPISKACRRRRLFIGSRIIEQCRPHATRALQLGQLLHLSFKRREQE